MKNNSLTSYTAGKKYTTALEALKAPEPSIAQIKRDRGETEFKVNIAAILERLFSARYSKQQLNPVLVDEFSAWVSHKDNYYFLKLPEIELALMDYRGETFHVIDLEALKTMIEDFDMRRCQAVEETRPEPEQSKEAAPMPEKTKQLLNKLLVSTKLNIKPSGRLPNSLEELFEVQRFKNIDSAADALRQQWSTEWEVISNDIKKYREMAIEFGERFNEPKIGTKERFIRQKESAFIYCSKIRIYDEQ